jgi:ParB family chromosome partitioning protein
MTPITTETSKQKSNEWYTPAKYIEAARAVMGGIDLDPASCALANQTVKATRYFTKDDDGLSQIWGGKVWLNPPYSSPLSPAGMSGGKRRGPTELWIQKLIDSFESGDVSQAIVCINADTVRAWFQCLWEYTICFVSRPIQFIRVDQKPEHHFFGTAFVYLGPHESRFIEVFSRFGTIAKRVSPVMTHEAPRLWESEVCYS